MAARKRSASTAHLKCYVARLDVWSGDAVASRMYRVAGSELWRRNSTESDERNVDPEIFFCAEARPSNV